MVALVVLGLYLMKTLSELHILLSCSLIGKMSMQGLKQPEGRLFSGTGIVSLVSLLCRGLLVYPF